MKREDARPKNNTDEEQDEETETEKQQDQIYQSGSITTDTGKHKIHCLTIIGQVEGHYILPPQNKTTKYEHVIPQLVAIEQDKSIRGLLIILNTVGGDVEAGLAIAELVAGMKTPTVSLVLGGGHSIGVPLAVSAKYSFIAPTATMTVHPVRMNGVMLGVPQTLSYFDKMQERISGFVTQNSRITAKRFKQLMMNSGELVMDIGTVLDGEKAVEEGLIDSLGGLSEATEKLYELIESSANEKQAQDAPKPGKGKRPGPKAKTSLKAEPAAKKKPKAASKAEPAAKKKPKTAPRVEPAARLDLTAEAKAEPQVKSRSPGRPKKEA